MLKTCLKRLSLKLAEYRTSQTIDVRYIHELSALTHFEILNREIASHEELKKFIPIFFYLSANMQAGKLANIKHITLTKNVIQNPIRGNLRNLETLTIPDTYFVQAYEIQEIAPLIESKHFKLKGDFILGVGDAFKLIQTYNSINGLEAELYFKIRSSEQTFG